MIEESDKDRGKSTGQSDMNSRGKSSGQSDMKVMQATVRWIIGY